MPGIIMLMGWVGMLCVLLAYARREKLPLRPYAAFNLAGSALLAVVCFAQEAWPPFALQIAWGAIAVRDLLRRPLLPPTE
jgi:hypothetical protein